MCGEIFWKKVFVFWLTFGLGVLVSGLFVSNDLPAQNIQYCSMAVKELPSENPKIPNNEPPKCVPLDGTLKHERLTAEEKTKLETKKRADKKNSLKDGKEKQNTPTESEPQFYDPSKDTAEYKTLLHKEKCYESDGRK